MQLDRLKYVLAVLFFVVLLSVSVSAIGNPAAVYCEEMGYNFVRGKTAGGDSGVCVVDGKKFDAWDFFEGEVGEEDSYCEKNNYDLEIKTDGKGTYSRRYAVCVEKRNFGAKILHSIIGSSSGPREIPMSELMGLDEKLGGDEEVDFSDFLFDEPARASRTTASSVGSSSLPADFDWRNNNGNWMTPVKDQGSCNGCTVFTALGAVEAVAKISFGNENNNPDFSEQEVISCQSRNVCADGGYISGALNYILNYGVVEEAIFSYLGYDVQCNIPDGAEKYFIEGWEEIDSLWSSTTPIEKREITKQALIDKGSLSVKMWMDGSFDGNEIYKCGQWPLGNKHAAVIVGYEDTGDIHTSYWNVKNSWGTGFGDQGYFKVGWDWNFGSGVYDQCGILFYPPYSATAPEVCSSHVYSECSNGDSYWYDSCGNQEELKEDCSDGCDAGECVVNCDVEVTQIDYAYFVGGGENVQVVGDYAYLGDSCFVSVNISDVNNVNNLDSICGDGRAFNIKVVGDYAYASREEYGFIVMDVSDPSSLEIVGNYDDNPERVFLKRMNGIDIQGNYAYVANHGEGLKIIDVSDKSNLIKISEIGDGRGYAKDVQIVGNYAYVADTWGGLDIIDVSDKSNPEKVGGLSSIENAMDLYVEGDYAYVADWGRGLKIIDVSDVNNPELVGELATGGYSNEGFASGVYVKGDYAYVAAYKQGFWVVDISDKTNPEKIAEYKSEGVYRGVYADNDYVYLAKNNYESEDGRGLEIVSVDVPSCGATPSGESSPAIFNSINNQPASAPSPLHIIDEEEQSNVLGEVVADDLQQETIILGDNEEPKKKTRKSRRSKKSSRDRKKIDWPLDEEITDLNVNSVPFEEEKAIKLISLNRNSNSKQHGFFEMIYEFFRSLINGG